MGLDPLRHRRASSLSRSSSLSSAGATSIPPSSTLRWSAGRRERDGKFRVLVVSDGSSTSQAFHDEVVAHAAGRPLEVLVVAPALGSRLSHWTGDDHAREEARDQPGATVSRLVDAGVAARGEVGSDDPIQAADDALREFPADEIVFATHPEAAANWKERGVVEIARGRYQLPVTHVVVDAD